MTTAAGQDPLQGQRGVTPPASHRATWRINHYPIDEGQPGQAILEFFSSKGALRDGSRTERAGIVVPISSTSSTTI